MRIFALAGNRFRLGFVRAPVFAICIASGLLLSGCAGINGVQDPVTDADVTTTVCPNQEQLNRFADTSDLVRKTNQNPYDMSQQAYRDTIVNNCIKAIRRNFDRYTSNLHRDSTAVKLGLDGAILTLSGLAAVGNGAKNAGAAIEGLVGANAAINHDVYFDQTFSALINAMETNRNEILIRLRANQRKSAAEYTLGDAGSDLADLESASNISLAIGKMISVTDAKKVETADLILPAPAISASLRPADVQTQVEHAAAYVQNLTTVADGHNKLVAIAHALGMTDDTLKDLKDSTIAENIRDNFDATTPDQAGLDSLKTKLGSSMPPEAWK